MLIICQRRMFTSGMVMVHANFLIHGGFRIVPLVILDQFTDFSGDILVQRYVFCSNLFSPLFDCLIRSILSISRES